MRRLALSCILKDMPDAQYALPKRDLLLCPAAQGCFYTLHRANLVRRYHFMKETVRLYDTQPYNTEFDATILFSCEQAPGEIQVILSDTLFFPEEGGQTPDRGTLAGLPVADVQISKDRIITHTLKAIPEKTAAALTTILAPGQTIHGILDWQHRYSNMQNHSGEHILSGLLHRLWGYENVGFRLSDNTVTLDTSGVLSREDLLLLEERANEAVWSNVPITCEYPPEEVLQQLDYRSKKEIDGRIRIVTIEGIDVCACCAPHVRRTGEIGLIKILAADRSKDSTRLTIVCGRRALLEMQRRQQQLEKASHLMNEPQETVSSGVQRLLNEVAELKEACRAREQQYLEARLDHLRTQFSDTGSLSERDLYLFESGLSVLSQRSFMNALCDMGWRYAGIFVGNDADGWKYLIGGRGADARIPNGILRGAFQARGGGKPDMVQGTVMASKEAILRTLSEKG